MAPAGDAGAPFRMVARADLDALVGGFQPRGERAAVRAPRHPVTATALLFDPGGETLHVACAGAEVCVAHCRVAQGTTPSGDVRARFVVDDVTPSPRPAPSPEVAPFRPEPSPHVPVVDRTIRELCAISGNRRCVAARADSGVEVHYYDARCSSDARGTPCSANGETNASSESRVFVIPDTAGASAVASDVSASASASAEAYVAVASPGGRKRVVVYAVPPLLTTRGEATVVFDIAADIILGLAHPARAMTWLGATLVIGTPRGAVAVRVADGYATPVAGAFAETAPVSPKRRGERRARARAAALAALAPRRPSPSGASYETMFGSDPIGSRADEAEDDGGEATEAPAAPALAVASGGAVANGAAVAAPTPADVSIVARAPDGTLLRVWLHGEAEDEDEDEDDADADRGTASASANAPAVFVLDDASKNGDFFARSEPVALTCAFPFAVAAPRGGTREKLARAVDLTGLAPGDSHVLALGMSGDGARENRGEARTAENRETRLLIAGAPRGAALGRGDDRNDAMENRDPASFSCPASASALLAARGGTLELYRARSTRERVVALAVAGRLEEAVALADARGGDVPPQTGSDASSSPSFAVLTRAECGFLAVARLDFELAASLWRSVGDALSLSELLPYFPRQGESRTAFRGRVEASAVGAGAETDEKRFVKRLGARETVSAFSRPGAPCLADLETVVAAHASRPEPREVGRLCRDAKRALVPLFAARPARDGDPRKRRLDTLTLRLWAETGDAERLERALLGEETTETETSSQTRTHTKEEQSFATSNGRDVDVAVLGPACTSSGRHFARAIVHWRLERNDDAAFETYAALSGGALVEAPAEGTKKESSPRVAAARLAARLLRERCREDLRGDARPSDEDVRRWTRRHVAWILREAPEEGVAALASPRVARAADLQFIAEACVAANATRATRARVLRDRVRPFAPDRANGDAHTALAVALWEAEEEAQARALQKDADGSPPSEDVPKTTSPASQSQEESLAAFLRLEPRRVDARAALAALDPNAVTSSSVRGTLALGLVTGVRVAPPAIPKALARHAAALAELRAAVGDHVAAYRLLAEVAGDARAADAHVARFGDDARRARDRVLEMASRSASRAPDPKPRFSLRGKVS